MTRPIETVTRTPKPAATTGLGVVTRTPDPVATTGPIETVTRTPGPVAMSGPVEVAGGGIVVARPAREAV